MAKKRYKFISAVHFFMFRNDDEILLSRRYNTGYEDGNYSVVAGHIDANERARSAMVREAKEEVGITLRETNLEVVHVMHRMGNDQERIDFFMKTKLWDGTPKILEPDKCDNLTWFKLNNLPDNIVPYVQEAIIKMINGEYYSEFDWQT